MFEVAGIPITCHYTAVPGGYSYSMVDRLGEVLSMEVAEINPYADAVRLISLAYKDTYRDP